MLRERRVISEARLADIVIWRVPDAVPGSRHEFKYSLAFVVDGVCVLRFDNEAGKGDHRHGGLAETPYQFRGIPELVKDFWDAIEAWRPE